MEILIIFYAAVLGAVFASFCSAIAWRTSKNGGQDKFSIWTGRSVCPHCEKQLPWWALVPVFSYTFLKGRCFNCKKKISIYYFLAELISGVFISAVVLKVLHNEISIYYSVIIIFSYFVLLILSFQDIWFEEISDKIAIPSIFIILFSQIIFYVFFNFKNFEDFVYILLILIIVLVIFGTLVIFTNAMGGGDLRVFALLALLFPFQILVLIFTLAFILASVGGSVTVLLQKRKNYLMYHVRLIPYMLIGMIIVFIFQEYFSRLLLGL